MAFSTSFLYRAVFIFDFGNCIAQRLMAAQTQGIGRLDEVILVIGSMRVMALYAVSVNGHLVRAHGLFGYQVFMALDANVSGVSVQQLAVRSGVGVIASGAFPPLDRGMNRRAFELILKCVMTGETKLS